MRKFVVMLAFGGLMAGLSAVPAAAGGGNVDQFCKAWLALDRADEATPRLINRAQDTAPSDLADTVETVISLFEELGEDRAFADPTFTEGLADIDGFVVDECGYENFDVAMQDYAFSGVPDEVEKGKVAFTLTNEGVELHELSVYKLKGDNTLEDIVAAEDEEAALELVTPVKGGGFAFPGASDVAFFTFKKTGDYVALCAIPVGTTPDAEEATGPPHLAEGMIVQFEVT